MGDDALIVGAKFHHYLDMLKETLPIDIEGVSHEDWNAAFDRTTAKFNNTKIPGWQDRLIPEALAETTTLLKAICSGDDSKALAETVSRTR